MRKVGTPRFVTLKSVMEAPHEWSFPDWGDEIAKSNGFVGGLSQKDKYVIYSATYAGWGGTHPYKGRASTPARF